MQRRTALQAAGLAAAAGALALTTAGGRDTVARPPGVLLLGDSLTWGQTGPGTALPGGFRAPLHDLLRARGVPHRFAGSRRDNGTAALRHAGQDAHEGWPGYRVDQAAALDLPAVDVALVLLGTNDVDQARGTAGTVARLRELLPALPVRRTVLVAPPPYLRAATDDRPDPLSAGLARALSGDAVDAWTPFLLPDGRADRALVAADGVHLTAAGYARLAALLAPPLAEALQRP